MIEDAPPAKRLVKPTMVVAPYCPENDVSAPALIIDSPPPPPPWPRHDRHGSDSDSDTDSDGSSDSDVEYLGILRH